MLQNRKFQIMVVWLIIAISHSEERHRHHTMRQLEQRMKQTQEREHKAGEILKYMNTEADVCNDFFAYACGNWLQEQNTDMTSEGGLISVQGEMEKLVNKQLQAILKQPINSQDSMASKVAKDFYRSCLRVPAYSPAQKQLIQSFVLNHGGLPDISGSNWKENYNWVHFVADLRRNYGFDILIGLTIDKINRYNKVIFIEEPQTTLLPVELCSSLATRQIDVKDQAFDEIQQEIKENLKKWFEWNESNALRIAGAIISFEFDLCKYMRIDQTTSILDNEENEGEEEEGQQQERERDREHTRNTKRKGYATRIVDNKIHGLKQNTANPMQTLRSLTETYQINFKDFVEHSLDTATISQVYFRSEEYFQQLSIISKKGLRSYFAEYIMYRALSEINFPLNQRPTARPFYCINQITRYLPQVMGKLYSEQFVNDEAQRDMLDIFSDIKEAFKEYLRTEVNWMNNNTQYNTKKEITRRISSLKMVYPSYGQNEDFLRGFPLHNAQDDYWHKLLALMMYNANQTKLSLSLTDDHYNIIEAPAVGIQQNLLNNELVVGYGLLQKPFYSEFYSRSLKYSSIGVAIAREIIKTLDLERLQQDPKNTFEWDTSDIKQFSHISECFRAQMSNHLHNEPYVYRNATKLRETWAEASALNVAFSAYQAWLDKELQKDLLKLETLPDINLSNTQIFFLNFAQTHCAARKNLELAPDFLPLSRRTMEQYDVNGPLSNSVEFGRDFGCTRGSDMNLDDKCLLY